MRIRFHAQRIGHRSIGIGWAYCPAMLDDDIGPFLGFTEEPAHFDLYASLVWWMVGITITWPLKP